MHKKMTALILSVAMALASAGVGPVWAAETVREASVVKAESELPEGASDLEVPAKETEEYAGLSEEPADLPEASAVLSEESADLPEASAGLSEELADLPEESAVLAEKPVEEAEEPAGLTEDLPEETEMSAEVSDADPSLPPTAVVSFPTETFVPDEAAGESPDALFSHYVNQSFYGDVSLEAMGKVFTGTRLEGNDYKIYEIIAGQLPCIAAGQRESTVFEITAEELGLQASYTAEDLGVSELLVEDGDHWAIAEDAAQALGNLAAFDSGSVVHALLADFPYELYWYDKTAGTAISTFDYSSNGSTISYTGQITLCFGVADEFSSGKYAVDTSIGQKVQAAVDNANAVVESCSGSSNLDKLIAYKDAICQNVDYSYDAVSESYSLGYGNPWQMIWVFDGDDTTSVVCEGYAKAFKYLCDQSEFDGDIECLLVTGEMTGATGAGGHMWNIVRMDDGCNYMADVTNCDSGTIGAPDGLFLVRTEDVIREDGYERGYIFHLDNGDVTYCYDDIILSYYSQREISIAYEHNLVHIPAREATCTEEGNIECWICSECGRVYTDADGTTEITEAEIPIPARGHVWDDAYTVDREATSAEEGSESIHCSVCGAQKEGSQRVVPRLEKSVGELSVTGISPKTYTGKALKQKPVVMDGSKTLENGTDYTLSYKNNKNAGTATVTITGLGNYTGSIDKTFTIKKSGQTITAKAGKGSVPVGKTTVVEIEGAKGGKTYKSSDTSIATVDAGTGKVTAKKVGTVKITATAKATSNYKAASKTVTIKVLPAATKTVSASNLATGVKIKWKKVAGANGYVIYRNDKKIQTLSGGATLTYTDKDANTNGTKYTYKVYAKASTGTSTIYRSSAIYRLSRPAVKSLKNTSSGKMTVTWAKNAKAEGYQIQYSTDKTFKKGVKKVTITSPSTVSKVVNSLTKGKTYYVRIRSAKGSSWSAWSAAKSVKIKK